MALSARLELQQLSFGLCIPPEVLEQIPKVILMPYHYQRNRSKNCFRTSRVNVRPISHALLLMCVTAMVNRWKASNSERFCPNPECVYFTTNSLKDTSLEMFSRVGGNYLHDLQTVESKRHHLAAKVFWHQ